MPLFNCVAIENNIRLSFNLCCSCDFIKSQLTTGSFADKTNKTNTKVLGKNCALKNVNYLIDLCEQSCYFFEK